jgi:hypothetical protein
MSTDLIHITVQTYTYEDQKVTRGKRIHPPMAGINPDVGQQWKYKTIRLEGLKLLARNVDNNFHTVSLLLHEKLGNTVLNSRQVDFEHIPPGSEVQRELPQFTEFKGVWSITGMIIDGQIYAYNQSLPRMTQKGGDCFVANAVYQDPKHPNVEEFRGLRDEFLVRFETGQNFIDWYHRNGPNIAASLERLPILRSVTKAILTPIAHGLKIIRKHKPFSAFFRST